MLRNLLLSVVTLLAILFVSCNLEYVEPEDPGCIESFATDTTMVHPSVYLDYPGNENGIWDPADIIFSNYEVQLIDGDSHEMMEQAHVPNWMGHVFNSVEPGVYYIRFIIPDGYEFVMMDSTVEMFDSDYDSDVISEDGYSDAFEIQCHEQITEIKAIIQKI